jgi:two-component system OmpR family response regulator
VASRILVVDDEKGIRDLVQDALRLIGLEVTTAEDGLTALKYLRTQKWDLCIFDINLPGIDGYTLLEKLREQDSHTPVLMLSARGESVDVNRGLLLGADDYVRKPFGLEELVLRAKALLKRVTPENDAHYIIAGPITIDEDRYEVRFHGELIELSKTEYRLLIELATNAGRVLTKEYLLENVWGIDFHNNSTVVDTYISYLRKKLHKDGFEGIRTVRGIGFTLEVSR